jgi:hypothetical protein
MITHPVQFFTTGVSDWRRVLPAGPVRDFYVQIYPHGRRWDALPTPMLEASRAWVESDFARADGDRLMPMIPILTKGDRDILHPWFGALAAHTVTAVGDALPAFRRLAAQFSDRRNSAEHILAILILWTINMWVLRRLLSGPIGRHPTHGNTGRYFIWGEELGAGPTAMTGIRAIRGTLGYGLCLIVSRIVARPGLKDARRLYARTGDVSAVNLLVELATNHANIPHLAQRWGIDTTILYTWLDEQRRVGVLSTEEPPQVCVPVFGPQAMGQIAPVCDSVAQDITDWLLADRMLERLLAHCSFTHCPSSTILCMLWHNSYYDATDRLIAQGVMQPFPAVADGEWGVWLTAAPYGWGHTAVSHAH